MFGWFKRSRAAGEAASDTQASNAQVSIAQMSAAQKSAPLPPSARDDGKRGVELIRAGRFAEACDALRVVVRTHPDDAGHLVNLAYALQQCGGADEARGLLETAVEVDPRSFDAHFMLAAAHEARQQIVAAEAHYQRAIDLNPEFAPARIELCRILAQKEGGAEAARAAIASALKVIPDAPELHLYLGNLSLADKDSEAAIGHYERALAAQPGDVPIGVNLALAMHEAGDRDAAIARLQTMLDANPGAAEAHAALGLIFKAEARYADAEAALRLSLELRPDNVDSLNTLGSVLQALGRTEEAAVCFRRVVDMRPDMPGGYANLGLVLYELGDVAQAVELYRHGLSIKSIAEMHDNLGIALQKQGHVDEAIVEYRKALALQPDNVNTQCNYAVALAEGGQPKDAVAAYRKILLHHPDHMVARSNLLFNLSVDPGCTPESYLNEARVFDEKARAAAAREPLERLPPPKAKSRLRVGFVSGDLRIHPVGFFLEGILHNIDRSRFELYAYSTVVKEDALTARMRSIFSGWHLLKGLADPEAARCIRDDAVDILIDLSGHTGDNRLAVLAFRPAPVQVTWLGYFASTGLSAMDYVLADPLCVPAGSEAAFTEKVWRLPDTRLCFTAPAAGTVPDVAASPVSGNGHVTFGSFQRLPKINDAVLDVWGRVFAAVPTARLLLQSHQTGRKIYVDEILARLGKVGITPDRVEVRGPAPRNSYLESYAGVDIVLDTFPYTGGTTTCEALWMGVPTLTLAGDSMIGLQGVAMMSAAGLADWVARTPDDYVAKAASFASDIPGLARLRAGMRDTVRRSKLFDVAAFARSFEDALEQIWSCEVGRRGDVTRQAPESVVSG